MRKQISAAKQFAEKLDSRCPAPEGATDSTRLAVSLKRYPDTKLRFSANCKAACGAGSDGTMPFQSHSRIDLIRISLRLENQRSIL